MFDYSFINDRNKLLKYDNMTLKVSIPHDSNKNKQVKVSANLFTVNMN